MPRVILLEAKHSLFCKYITPVSAETLPGALVLGFRVLVV